MDNRRRRRNTRKNSKTYYVGMMVLFILCAMYMIMYQRFGLGEGSNNTGSSGSATYETAENSAQLISEEDDSGVQSAAEAAIAAIEEKEELSAGEEDGSDAEEEAMADDVGSEEASSTDDDPTEADGAEEASEATDDMAEADTETQAAPAKSYKFKYHDRLSSHYEKHGIEMGFSSEEEYLAAANALIANPDALHKTEAEDGDDVYYLESTDEIAFVSKEGYIRTYFICSGKAYYDRQ